MKFSLVTTCLNEINSFPRWRSDIEKQTRLPVEIVIVDALSTDGTMEALKIWSRENPKVRVHFEQCSAARGRNLAIEKATFEHVVSTDMGVTVTPNWFEEIVKPFESDPDVQVVMGSAAIDKSTVKSPAARAEYFTTGDGQPFVREQNGSLSLRPGRVPGNLSLAYTKTAWESLGRLPEDLTLYADDSVFGRQIMASHFKIAFAPSALVLWPRHQKLNEFWAEEFRYGKGDGEAAIKTPIAFKLYKRGKLPRSIVPLLTALRGLMRISFWRALARSVGSGDIAAGLFIPVLVFGKGYNLAKGYIVGDERGSIHCIECRGRLKNIATAR